MNNTIKEKDANLIKLEKEYWNKILDKGYNKVNFNKVLNENKRNKKELKVKLDSEKVTQLIKMCKNDDMLIHTILLTVFKVLINKYFQSTDFLIGIPQYIKSSDIKSNNVFLVLNNNINQANTFKQEIIEVKKEVLEAYVYQFCEVEEHFISRDIYNKINIYCCMNTIHSKHQIEDILNLNNNELTLIIEKHNNNNNNNVELIFDYWDTSISDEVDKIKSIFVNILNSVIENILININEIEILTEVEKNKILYEFNDTEAEYPRNKTIQELFEEQVERTPDNVAVVFLEKELTYKELNEKSNQIARILRNKGVKPDSIVGIMVERSLEMVVGIMGILKAGSAYLPIDPSCPRERIEYMLKNSNSDILLTSESLKNNIEFFGEIIDLFNFELYKGDLSNLESINTSKDLAYVIYTSGTTGNPKGVMIPHSNLNNYIYSLIKQFNSGFSANDRVLSLANYVFDASVSEFFVSLTSGATLIINNKHKTFDVVAIAKLIVNNNVTYTYIPPSLLNYVFEELKAYKCKISLNKLFVGTESILGETLNKFYSINKDIEILNAYGPTEVTICATFYKLIGNESEDKVVSIGIPLRNTRVYILNKELRIVPIGAYGELCVSGDGLSRGYINNDKLTKEKFIDNPYEPGEKMYRTGDLARWLPDGNIEFLGRIDNQVKIRGFRIELGEIESNLLKIQGIKQTIVLAKERNDNKYLCAYYVGEKEYSISELREELKRSLPDYMIPSYFIKIKSIPITPNGKIDKESLPEPNDQINTGAEYEAARNKFEELVIKAWSKVLGVERIGINDNFFDLGGNSLNAVKIVSLLVDENINILISDIFMYQNIKGISDKCMLTKHADEEDKSNSICDYQIIDNLDEYINTIKKEINIKYDKFTKNIINRRIVNKYKLSEIQKITHDSGITMSGTKIELNFEVDITRLESVVRNLINGQAMLRGSIVKIESDMYIYEYDKIEEVSLPFIDLCSVEQEKRTLIFKEAIRDVNIKIQENNNYVENKIYYALILVKNASNNYALYMLANHLIFDGMSSEILKNLVIKEYRNYGNSNGAIEEKVTYLDYINQIRKGPKEITEEDIIKKFNLNEFLEICLVYYEKLNKIKHKLVVKKLEFELPSGILNNQNQIWEFAFEKFVGIYRRNLGIENLPVRILNMGRKFGEKNYFTVIGEFLDVVPYVCKEINSNLKAIEGIINLASEKNINFTTILKDEELSQKYKKTNQILSQSKISDSNIPIFNYLGLYDTDYNIAHLYKLSEDLNYIKENKTQRGVNCYIRDNKLIMFIDEIEDMVSTESLENSNLK